MELASDASAAEDRRRKELRLTKNGRKLEQRLTATQMQLLSDVFEGAGRRAENGWREVMGRLKGGNAL